MTRSEGQPITDPGMLLTTPDTPYGFKGVYYLGDNDSLPPNVSSTVLFVWREGEIPTSDSYRKLKLSDREVSLAICANPRLQRNKFTQSDREKEGIVYNFNANLPIRDGVQPKDRSILFPRRDVEVPLGETGEVHTTLQEDVPVVQYPDAIRFLEQVKRIEVKPQYEDKNGRTKELRHGGVFGVMDDGRIVLFAGGEYHDSTRPGNNDYFYILSEESEGNWISRKDSPKETYGSFGNSYLNFPFIPRVVTAIQEGDNVIFMVGDIAIKKNTLDVKGNKISGFGIFEGNVGRITDVEHVGGDWWVSVDGRGGALVCNTIGKLLELSAEDHVPEGYCGVSRIQRPEEGHQFFALATFLGKIKIGKIQADGARVPEIVKTYNLGEMITSFTAFSDINFATLRTIRQENKNRRVLNIWGINQDGQPEKLKEYTVDIRARTIKSLPHGRLALAGENFLEIWEDDSKNK